MASDGLTLHLDASQPQGERYEYLLGDVEQVEEEEALISASITDDQLRALTGSHQFETVDFLQLAVDSSCVPLDTLGERLPRLEQLKLNGSNLPSVRELGTSLSHLRVLWLCRCGLAELDGMSALPELQELYLAFNDIEKLDSLAPLDQLQVLDLEANVVSDMNQVEWLQFLPAVKELTLRGNPVAEARSYRASTLALLPRLELLDDEDPSVLDAPDVGSPLRSPRLAAAASPDAPSAAGLEPASPSGAEGAEAEAEARRRHQAEELLVNQAIKYAEVGRVFDVSFDGRAMLGGSSCAAGARPVTAAGSVGPSTAAGGRAGGLARPSTSMTLIRPATATLSATKSGYAGMSRNLLDGSLEEEHDGSSELTMAGSEVLCGVGALRRNKLMRQLNTAPAAQPSPSRQSLGGDSPPGSPGAFFSAEAALSNAPTADASTGSAVSPMRGGKGVPQSPPPRQLPPGAELDCELMNELRALKLQLLLRGEAAGDLSDDERLSEEEPPPPQLASGLSPRHDSRAHPLTDEAEELLPTRNTYSDPSPPGPRRPPTSASPAHHYCSRPTSARRLPRLEAGAPERTAEGGYSGSAEGPDIWTR